MDTTKLILLLIIVLQILTIYFVRYKKLERMYEYHIVDKDSRNFLKTIIISAPNKSAARKKIEKVVEKDKVEILLNSEEKDIITI